MFGIERRGRAAQTDREVGRAETLLTELLGLSRDAATAALQDQATKTGISVHAAALALIADLASSAPVLDGTAR